MPIFEYQCRHCGQQFEFLVRAGAASEPTCPKCQSTELERLLSIPAVQSESTHGLAMKAAKKRDKVAASDQARAQREYELHHND